MAYTQDCSQDMIKPVGTGVLAEEDMSAAVAVHGEYIVTRNCKIKRIGAYVTLAVAASTTAPVLTFRKRLSYGTSGSQVTLGTLTIPNGAALGKVYYKDISPVSLAPGQSICFDHTTQAVDASSAAGKVIYFVELELDPEVVGNSSNMVASA